MRLGGIDAGGTTFKLMIGTGPDLIEDEHRVPTTRPAETLAAVAAWFAARGPIDAIGIGSFGPVVSDRSSADHGRLLITPKPGWSHVDLVTPLRDALNVPITLESDVVAAAMAEQAWGAARGCRATAYVTIGTGVGVGMLVGGQPAHGLMQAEGGHIFVPIAPVDRAFAGACSHHGACLEGLVSAAAIRARWQCGAEQLADDHDAWRVLGHYVGHLAHLCVMLAGVDRVVLGGGIGTREILAHRARQTMGDLIGTYTSVTAARGGPTGIITPAALGTRSGALGALLLARDALEQRRGMRVAAEASVGYRRTSSPPAR